MNLLFQFHFTLSEDELSHYFGTTLLEEGRKLKIHSYNLPRVHHDILKDPNKIATVFNKLLKSIPNNNKSQVYRKLIRCVLRKLL